ncbi:MAG TPA: ATP-binding protein [Longimicrobium sp.]|nr:ATP-binding protein [Longimicrobium sp.]
MTTAGLAPAPGVDPRANAACIDTEAEWFRAVLELRLRVHAGERPPCGLEDAVPPPALPAAGSPYADVVRSLELNAAERLLLVLAYLPHVRPHLLDPFFIRNQALDRPFTEFGGYPGLSHAGFLPTGETAMFLLAGDDLDARLRHQPLFHPAHPLHAGGVLRLQHRHGDEPRLAAALQVAPEYVERFATGRPYRPPFSAEFPAQAITTPYGWDDLVLDAPTREEVDDVVAWARNQRVLLDEWGLRKRLKPGFRTLFHGPPGTGKTLTACLLGKATEMEVYRIDLSKVVSKYIGETEKNLASVFDLAEHGEWILFFDEADALFGKRTDSHSANDRAANQQIAYLLQRMEDFPGIVILATNLRGNLDEAFARRFQSMVHFAMPGEEQRLRLWRESFEGQRFRLAADVDLPRLARDHQLSGGSIINVLRYAALRAVARDPREVRGADLVAGVRRELHKSGKFTTGGH